MVEPSGLSFGYFGCAAGKAAASARSLIEKLDLKNMKCRDAVVEAAKMYGFILFLRSSSITRQQSIIFCPIQVYLLQAPFF